MMSSTSTVTNRNLQVFESENRCDTFVLDLSHRGIGLDELSEWSLSVDLNNQAQFPGQVAVRLGFNSLGNLGAQFVGEFLTEDNAIGSLDLCFNDIDDIGIQKLSESLTLNSTLRILHISGNRVTANGFKYIAYALQQNAHLQSLYATGNSAGADGCYAIAQALCINQTLRTLCLSGNKIGPTGAAHLSAALCHNSHLRELVLSDNQLGDDGIRELSNALHHNRQLELLDVSFNGISSAGAEELCHSLVDYSSLKSLLLDNNKLRDAGAKSVASILPSMRLHVLNVGFNEIETDGVAAILLSILPNETMTTLSLSGNSINNDVSLVIANILKQDRVLMQLNLDHINVGAMGERNIAVGIATNMFSALQSLTGFHLGQVLVQLGSPPTLATMPNDHALRYLHSMWSLHLGGDNHGNFNLHATTTPPPAVLGSNVPPVEVQTSSISSPATGKTKVPVVYSTEAPDQGRTRSSFYGTGCSNSGVSVTAVSTLLDSINFIGSRQTANKNNSISYNTPSSPGASFPIASAECMDPVSSSSVSQLHVGTMTNEGANSSHIVTSPSKLSFNRSSSFACAQALSSAMMEFDRLYREIEGDDLLGLDDILATEQKESGQMEEVLSSVPSHSGTESNENDMTDSADDVADIDALEQRNEALENGALWSHTLRLQMQQTPDFQISENIKV